MNRAAKQGCLWGCGLLTLILVAVAGTGTWYAVRMTTDFKAVKSGEEELLAAVPADSAYAGNLDQPPARQRVAAFLDIRRGLHERRLMLAQEVADFREVRAGDHGGPLGFFKSLRAGTELTPVYAGFWQKRNELLRTHGMGPREYSFLYRLLYFTWLGHDPHDGARTPTGTSLVGSPPGNKGPGTPIPPRAPVWEGRPAALDSALAGFRTDLEALYSPVLNPLEILFVETTPAADPG